MGKSYERLWAKILLQPTACVVGAFPTPRAFQPHFHKGVGVWNGNLTARAMFGSLGSDFEGALDVFSDYEDIAPRGVSVEVTVRDEGRRILVRHYVGLTPDANGEYRRGTKPIPFDFKKKEGFPTNTPEQRAFAHSVKVTGDPDEFMEVTRTIMNIRKSPVQGGCRLQWHAIRGAIEPMPPFENEEWGMSFSRTYGGLLDQGRLAVVRPKP